MVLSKVVIKNEGKNMADETQRAHRTELIDVSDVEPNFNDDFQTVRESPRSATQATPNQDNGPVVASLKERFASLVLDLLVLYLLYWVAMIFFRVIAYENPVGPIPLADTNGIVFHGIFLMLAFLWFFIPELIFGTSLGKWICNLSVQSSYGTHPSFLSTLIRNIFRPIDIILSPLFLGTAIMEFGAWNKRIGDILARTIVLKHTRTPAKQYALSLDIVSSASVRVLAFVLDMCLLLTLVLGLALLLTPDDKLISMLIIVYAPVLIFFFWFLPESITKTSPGKWIFGLIICTEDGSAIDTPSAVVRTLWRVIDCNLIGYLTSLFSIRRQRPGDAAAGSVVIKSPREFRGFLGLILSLLISGIVLYAGFQNSSNFFFNQNFEINFLPTVDMEGGQEGAYTSPPGLVIRNIQFAVGSPTSIRKPPVYVAGETLFITFEVEGFKREKQNVWVQEDISVTYPDNSVGLKVENFSEYRDKLEEIGPISFDKNFITIPQNALVGRYTITITVRDKLSRQTLDEQRFFYVTPPETPTPNTEETSSPPAVTPPPPDEAPQPDLRDTESPPTFRQPDSGENPMGTGG